MADENRRLQDRLRTQADEVKSVIDGLSAALGDPQLRHLDHAWASTVHAFQGRTVDNVIAAMGANHPHLTTQKIFYVEISRARDRAELVTDDAKALREQLEAVTGERISALEGIGEAAKETPAKATEAETEKDQTSVNATERRPKKVPEPKRIEARTEFVVSQSGPKTSGLPRDRMNAIGSAPRLGPVLS